MQLMSKHVLLQLIDGVRVTHYSEACCCVFLGLKILLLFIDLRQKLDLLKEHVMAENCRSK